MLLRIVAGAYGVWLFLILLAFYAVSGHDEHLLQYAVMGGAVPGALQLLLLGFDSRGLRDPLILSLLVVLTVLASYLANMGNVTDWMPMIYTMNVIFLLSIGILVAGCPDRRLLPAAAAAYAVITGIFLIHINLNGTYLWGRLTAADIQPNFWGLIGLSVSVAALGFRRLVFAAPWVAIGCWTMYDGSSRSSMLGLAMALLVVVARTARELRGTRLYLTLAGVAMGALLTAVFWSSFDTATLDVGNDVLKLNDPYRGLDTGFSGRSDLWSSTFDLWLANPIFGVGFREHEQILNYPAHNGYLAMLADTGIFGLLLYGVMLVSSTIAAWRIPDPTNRRLVIAIIIAYAVMSLFERRAINTGNPFGFLIIMACFLALALEAQRRAMRRLALRPAPAYQGVEQPL